MKLLKIHWVFILFIALGVTMTSCGGQENASDSNSEQMEKQGKEYTSAYVCPMHCEGSGSDEPGKCPVCNMDYVANADLDKGGHDHDGHDHSHGDDHDHSH